MTKTQKVFREAYGYRNTLNTKLHGQLVDKLHPLWMNTPQGKEAEMYEKGQIVVATGLGVVKEGVRLEIEDICNNNGYIQYYASGIWHKQEDLTTI